MSNPVKNVPTANGSKVETPTVEKTPTNSQALAVQDPNLENSATLKVIESKTANTVFERLDEGMKMREIFNKSKERVSEFEDFAQKYEDEGLVMKIEKIGKSEGIQIQNVPMILDFIQNLVKTGKAHLKQLESEIVSFSI